MVPSQFLLHTRPSHVCQKLVTMGSVLHWLWAWGYELLSVGLLQREVCNLSAPGKGRLMGTGVGAEQEFSLGLEQLQVAKVAGSPLTMFCLHQTRVRPIVEKAPFVLSVGLVLHWHRS